MKAMELAVAQKDSLGTIAISLIDGVLSVIDFDDNPALPPY
jgi:hypothetical protein